MTAGSGARLTDLGLRGSHNPSRSSREVGRARVTGHVVTFHGVRQPVGMEALDQAGAREALTERDAAPTCFTTLGGQLKPPPRGRSPPSHMKQPVPVGCLPVPGKDITDARAWKEGAG